MLYFGELVVCFALQIRCLASSILLRRIGHFPVRNEEVVLEAVVGGTSRRQLLSHRQRLPVGLKRSYQIAFIDRSLVPAMSALEASAPPPFGQSLLAVLRRPA